MRRVVSAPLRQLHDRHGSNFRLVIGHETISALVRTARTVLQTDRPVNGRVRRGIDSVETQGGCVDQLCGFAAAQDGSVNGICGFAGTDVWQLSWRAGTAFAVPLVTTQRLRRSCVLGRAVQVSSKLA